MEDLKKAFQQMFNVIRLDLEKESYYLLEDSESKCYLMPSWQVGMFPAFNRPWLCYDISGNVWSSLASYAGGEWIKRDGEWL